MIKRTRWVLIGCLVLFILGMIAYPRIKRKMKSDVSVGSTSSGMLVAGSGRPALNVNAIVMMQQVLTDQTNSTGDLIPDEEVDLSFETSGKITDIYFKEGSHVRKGALLAKINDKPLLAQLKRLEAQIPLAQDKVFRQKTLLEKDAVSKEAFESVTTELDVLMADIEIVKANIAQTELRAPFDGIIGLRAVSEGAYTSPSTTVAKLTKIKPIKLEFPVPERYSDDITAGSDVVFVVEGSQQAYQAKVYAVESKVDMDTRTMKVRAIYANADESIKPGRYARVVLTKKEIKDALAIPSEAMIQELGRNVIYLYRSGKAVLTEIGIGIRTESQVQVIRGINAGDTVITSGIMQLRDSMAVSIDKLIDSQ